MDILRALKRFLGPPSPADTGKWVPLRYAIRYTLAYYYGQELLILVTAISANILQGIPPLQFAGPSEALDIFVTYPIWGLLGLLSCVLGAPFLGRPMGQGRIFSLKIGLVMYAVGALLPPILLVMEYLTRFDEPRVFGYLRLAGRHFPSMLPRDFSYPLVRIPVFLSLLTMSWLFLTISIFRKRLGQNSRHYISLLLISGGIVGGILVIPGSASSYRYEPIHSGLMTLDAVALLNRTSDQRFCELSTHVSYVQKGAAGEDSPISNVLDHFYRPTDGHALSLCLKDYCLSARERLNSEDFYNRAIAEYGKDHKELAYELLGHALHLATQDMFAPPHVHDDAHLFGGYLDWSDLDSWVYKNYDGLVANSPFRDGREVPR